jgi:hypothetical protein
MTLTVWTYILYLMISIGLTIWVAHTLHKSGRIFLVDSFHGNEPLADSVNHLLVVGFYLINIGYIAFALKTSERPATLEHTLELLSSKVGLVLLILGGMHFLNVAIFSKMRKRAQLEQMPPPIAPQAEYFK